MRTVTTFFCTLVFTIQATPISFNRDIRPILSNNCYQCHGPDSAARKANLRLDQETGSRAELKSGSQAVVPGNLKDSELIYRITSTDKDELMPPPKTNKHLTPQQINLLRQWVKEGGKYERHWSFIPPKDSPLPKVHQKNWPQNEIDHFILARLESAGLKPAPPADKAALLRRATLDLTGLPPTLPELDAYLADKSPQAYEKVVDRLLASPRYGEHMSRYWLDAARYADTNGYQYDTHRSMWPWRDWVIRAYNQNLSFDQFTIEQLAGDLLPNATLQQKVATGFNRNHPITIEGGVIGEEYRTEYVIDRATTTAQVWMGMSFLCARCHDHKFDPLTQKEFYKFFAFFNQVPERGQSGFTPNIKVPPTGIEETKAKLTATEAKLKALENEIAAAQVQWENTLKSNATVPVWHTLKPGPITGGAGTSFKVRSDQSVLVGGKSPPRETYRIILAAPAAKITALRLECLTDKSLPHKGAGRAFNSNFVLSEFTAKATTPDRANRIRFKQAAADYSQSGFNITAAIDGRADTGWAVDGPTKKENRMAMFIAETPIAVDVETTLEIELSFNYPNHAIGRFRLSYSTEATPQLSTGQSIPQIAAIAPDKRTAPQRQRLRKYFLETGAAENFKNLHTQVETLRAELTRRQSQGATTMIMQDMPNPRATHILHRGQYDQKRDEVSAGTPAFLPPLPQGKPNRLALAQWLVNGKHPLTARVAVNRQWQRLFGQGLVKTSEEFGIQGDWPTHPKLLDWLAVHFTQNDWNLKALLKLMVTSAAYQQSSKTTNLTNPEAQALYGHGPRHRLDAEVIRDNALAASGLLVNSLGGPSVFPYHPKGLWLELNNRPGYSRTYKQGTGNDLYRRSLYTYWKRTVPPPSMATFDAPEREFCLVRRSRTNTPLQAFVLLNDPQFIEAARRLASRMMATKTGKARIALGFRLTTSRLPTQKESEILHRLFNQRLEFYKQHPELARALLSIGKSQRANHPEIEHAAWTIVARALLNLNETITKN